MSRPLPGSGANCLSDLYAKYAAKARLTTFFSIMKM